MADTQEPTITTPVAPAAPVAPVADPISPEAVSKPVENVTAISPEAIASPESAKSETPVPPVTESVLGDEHVKTDEKKDAPKTEGKVSETKAEKPAETTKVEPPAYEDFKLPEGVNVDKEQLGEFTKVLGEIETGKLDHAGMQAAGQKLVDMATKATTDTVNRLNDYYVQIHETQKKDWFENSKNDPELGNGSEDTFREIASNLRSSIDTYAGNETQKAEFRQLMKDTGVGNHPAVLRMLNNMQKKIDSYTKETSGRSVPAQAPAPSKVKPYQSFYSGQQG